MCEKCNNVQSNCANVSIEISSLEKVKIASGNPGCWFLHEDNVYLLLQKSEEDSNIREAVEFKTGIIKELSDNTRVIPVDNLSLIVAPKFFE